MLQDYSNPDMKFRATILIILQTLAAFGGAQTPARQEPKPALTLRVETNLVALDVTAVDKNGEYVRDLRPDELEVYEDGKLKKLEFFAVNDEPSLTRPLAIVFALDTSGSLKPEEAVTLRESAMKFTQLMQGDSVFAAMTFNDKVNILQEFTGDPKKLQRALEKASRFEGSTRIYDAVDRAIVLLDKKAPRIRKGRPVRHIVLVISDGFDSASIIDRREMVRRANVAGVTVYSITLPSYMLSAARSGERVITPFDATRIVSATGGRDYTADTKDFTPIFKSLAEEMRASYALAYYPDWRDGAYHDIRVKTTRPGVVLRVNRTGYQATEK